MDYKYGSNHEVHCVDIYTPVFAISLKGSDEYAKETEN